MEYSAHTPPEARSASGGVCVYPLWVRSTRSLVEYVAGVYPLGGQTNSAERVAEYSGQREGPYSLPAGLGGLVPHPPQYSLDVRCGGVEGQYGREVAGRDDCCLGQGRARADAGAGGHASGDAPLAGGGAPGLGPLPGDAAGGGARAGVCAPAGDDAGGGAGGLVLSLSLHLSPNPNPNHSSLRGVFGTKYFKGWGSGCELARGVMAGHARGVYHGALAPAGCALDR